jgi:hypothetical protein
MMGKKLHNDMTQEEREKEAREYIEAQSPVKPETVEPLNEYGEHVPEPKAKK